MYAQAGSNKHVNIKKQKKRNTIAETCSVKLPIPDFDVMNSASRLDRMGEYIVFYLQ